MEDLFSIHAKTVEFEKKLEAMKIEFLKAFREKLWSNNNQNAEQSTVNVLADIQNINTPVQTKKKPKRLSSLNEDDDEADNDRSKTSILGDSPSNAFIGQNKKLQQFVNENKDVHMVSPLKPEPAPRKINLQLADDEHDNDAQEQDTENNDPAADIESVLMPPPPAPISMPSQSDTSIANQSTSRPQRAAKLKSEKLLKEPKLKTKLRRPDENEVKVKLEHENRASQMGTHNNTLNKNSTRTTTTMSSSSSLSVPNESNNKCEASILVIANKPDPAVVLSSDDERQEEQNKSANNENKGDDSIRSLRIKVKREKSSLSNEKLNTTKEEMPPPPTVPMPLVIKSETTGKTTRAASKKNTTAGNNTLSTTASSTIASEQEPKKTRKKNEHKPIKVERFSDIDRDSPVSTRSRKKKESNAHNQSGDNENTAEENVIRPRSIYEDAVDRFPTESTKRSSNDAKKKSGSFKKDKSLESNQTSNATMSANTTRTMEPNTNTGNATMVLDTTRTLGRVADNATMILGSGNLLMNATKTISTDFHGNETSQISDNGVAQTTFVLDNPNATRTITSTNNNNNNNDENDVSSSTKHSMQTARDTLQNDSIITNDESFEDAVSTKGKASAKTSTTTLKGTQTRSKNVPATTTTKNVLNKMTPGKHELFNPLLQSPVKYRVEAFEHAAQAAKADNKKVPLKKPSVQASCTTPTVGRLHNHATSRFLTPTQASNTTNSSILAAKKAPNSASKAMAFPKTITTSSSSTQASKTLSRENSGNDFRKNIQQLNEERKKQREQKHLLAAQQRDAKERERAERYNKLAKEKEEKRLKKKELDEIQQKLRLQEEAEKQRIAKERELALLKKQQQQQMAMKSMMPPAPKQTSKYMFEMLNENDSTDEETKTTNKRPLPPLWSQSHVRRAAILAQQSVPIPIIDSFFSVAPTTPDLREIFPNIDAKHLKRNSSAIWTTPPRYSELPKY